MFSEKIKTNYIEWKYQKQGNPVETYIKLSDNKEISEIVGNRNFRLNFVEKYIDKNWDWENISFEIKDADVFKFLNKPINWGKISQNSSLEFIENNLDLPWVWSQPFGDGYTECVSFNENLTLDFVFKYIDLNWNIPLIIKCSKFQGKEIEKLIETLYPNLENNDREFWSAVSQNENLSLEFLDKLINKKGGFLQYECLSSNNNLTLDFISTHTSRNFNSFWEPFLFLKNKAITLEQIENFLKKTSETEFVPWILQKWEYLSGNPNLTLEFIEKYIDKNWNFRELSKHPNLTIDLVAKYKEKRWDWKYITVHHSATFEKIKQYIYLPWNFKDITLNPHINLDQLEYLIKNGFEHKLDWSKLGYSDKITPEFFEKYNDKTWNLDAFVINPNFTTAHIRELQKKYGNLNLKRLAYNPSLTSEDIEKYRDIISCNLSFALNDFLYDDIIFTKNIKNDLKSRKEAFINLKIYKPIDKTISFYLSYI